MSRSLRLVLAATVGAGLLAAVPLPQAMADGPQGDRIAVLEGDALFVKEGDMDAEWEYQDNGVKKFQLDGDRVAILKDDGSLLAKEGDLGPGWHTVNADSVTDFQIRDGRIAFTEGPDLYVVEDGLGGEIVHQADNVKKFQIDGDRVGIITTDDHLLVKEGDLGPGWLTVSENNVTGFQLHDDRIAYTEGTDLWAQEGPLDAPSVHQDSDVKKFQLEADRVGALLNNGELLVKGGDLEPGWLTVSANNVTDFKLDGDRIAYVEGDVLWAQEGELDAESFVQEEGITAFDLNADRVAVVKDGQLLVKEGDLGPGWMTLDEDSATGVQLHAAPFAAGEDVTFEDLTAIYGFLPEEATIREGLPSLNQAMADGGITTPARKAAFLATLRNESGFRYDRHEMLNPERYKGRGYIQLTNDFNYRPAGQFVGYDLIANPDAAAWLEYSAPIARWYWTVARPAMNTWADELNMGKVNRGIGYQPTPHRDAQRCNDFAAALRYFNGGELPGAVICN